MSTASQPIAPAAGVQPPLTKKDFQSPQEVKWCPGCGDYGILAAVQSALPRLGIPREKVAFVSGIGCSSRFPYYLNTYGMHTIHGRAPAVALGLKCAQPDLSVWVVTGDGDGLSIGANHLLHCFRRNLDLNILLLNNEIYGLTKGQYSPTSEFGKKTKSSPLGSIEQPLHPVQIALAAGATFVARTTFSDQAHLGATLEAAARHKGTSFVEILQNCLVFNDGVFANYTERALRDEHRVMLQQGQPLRYGKDGRQGILVRSMEPKAVEIGAGGVTEGDLLVHDAGARSPGLASLLAALEPPEFPKAFGVFRQVERPTYNDLLIGQIDEAMKKRGRGDIGRLLGSGAAWDVT